MKRFLLIVFSCLSFIVVMAAKPIEFDLFQTEIFNQESALCGDWIGIYEGVKLSDELDEDGDRIPVSANYKAYIRIKILDGLYIVRMKTRIADESMPFHYEPDGKIEYADENSITWVIDLGDDYDWSSTAKEQGIKIGHSHDIMRCRVTLANGVLRYSEEPRTTYYDTQGRIINSKTWSWGRKFSLYKEESDW